MGYNTFRFRYTSFNLYCQKEAYVKLGWQYDRMTMKMTYKCCKVCNSLYFAGNGILRLMYSWQFSNISCFTFEIQ